MSVYGTPREGARSTQFRAHLRVGESLLASSYWRDAGPEQKLHQFWQFTADQLKEAKSAPGANKTVCFKLDAYFEDQSSNPRPIYDHDKVRMEEPFEIEITES